MKIAILTGAGISAESGISTFRGVDGLWEGHRIEEVASPEGFQANPQLVYEFYNLRRRQLKEVEPNAAHKALAKLERSSEYEVTIITQNVDDLHERGGSESVLHMHGELRKARCVNTGVVQPWLDDLTENDRSSSGGALRPHIVWFGEVPFYMDEIYKTVGEADIFISIGTSGNVYPAAGLVQIAKEFGVKTLEFNLDESQNSSAFDESYRGKAGETIPAWVEQMLSKT